MRPGETVFVSGDAYFASVFADIARAARSIVMESYIFRADALGKRLANALIDAAERGVAVRVLLDGVGTPPWDHPFSDQALENRKPLPRSLEVRSYHPASQFDLINRRNHRKLIAIDGRIAYAGGINVDSRYLSEIHGAAAWQDASVRLTGAATVAPLLASFESLWQSRPLPKGSDYRDRIRRILRAKKRVWITTPYFVPPRSLLRALRFAAWSGVDVRILFPSFNDVFFMRWVNRLFYRYLLRAGVRVFEYLPRFLHAKTMIIDDWAVVGSTNLNHRSILHDQELDIPLSKEQSLHALSSWFAMELTRSEEARLGERFTLRKLVESILARLALIFRNWL